MYSLTVYCCCDTCKCIMYLQYCSFPSSCLFGIVINLFGKAVDIFFPYALETLKLIIRPSINHKNFNLPHLF